MKTLSNKTNTLRITYLIKSLNNTKAYRLAMVVDCISREYIGPRRPLDRMKCRSLVNIVRSPFLDKMNVGRPLLRRVVSGAATILGMHLLQLQRLFGPPPRHSWNSYKSKIAFTMRPPNSNNDSWSLQDIQLNQSNDGSWKVQRLLLYLRHHHHEPCTSCNNGLNK